MNFYYLGLTTFPQKESVTKIPMTTNLGLDNLFLLDLAWRSGLATPRM